MGIKFISVLDEIFEGLKFLAVESQAMIIKLILIQTINRFLVKNDEFIFWVDDFRFFLDFMKCLSQFINPDGIFLHFTKVQLVNIELDFLVLFPHCNNLNDSLILLQGFELFFLSIDRYDHKIFLIDWSSSHLFFHRSVILELYNRRWDESFQIVELIKIFLFVDVLIHPEENGSSAFLEVDRLRILYFVFYVWLALYHNRWSSLSVTHTSPHLFDNFIIDMISVE